MGRAWNRGITSGEETTELNLNSRETPLGIYELLEPLEIRVLLMDYLVAVHELIELIHDCLRSSL